MHLIPGIAVAIGGCCSETQGVRSPEMIAFETGYCNWHKALRSSADQCWPLRGVSYRRAILLLGLTNTDYVSILKYKDSRIGGSYVPLTCLGENSNREESRQCEHTGN